MIRIEGFQVMFQKYPKKAFFCVAEQLNILPAKTEA
jgi:hypothetical protein